MSEMYFSSELSVKLHKVSKFCKLMFCTNLPRQSEIKRAHEKLVGTCCSLKNEVFFQFLFESAEIKPSVWCFSSESRVSLADPWTATSVTVGLSMVWPASCPPLAAWITGSPPSSPVSRPLSAGWMTSVFQSFTFIHPLEYIGTILYIFPHAYVSIMINFSLILSDHGWRRTMISMATREESSEDSSLLLFLFFILTLSE